MKRHIALFVLAVILTTGCGGHRDILDRSNVIPIDGKLNIVCFWFPSIFNYDANIHGYNLYLYTDRDYDCGNYTISTAISTDGNKVDVCIAGIKVPDKCSGYYAPAEILLDLPSDIGLYELNIIYTDFTLGEVLIDQYDMEIRMTDVLLTPVETQFTRMSDGIVGIVVIEE